MFQIFFYTRENFRTISFKKTKLPLCLWCVNQELRISRPLGKVWLLVWRVRGLQTKKLKDTSTYLTSVCFRFSMSGKGKKVCALSMLIFWSKLGSDLVEVVMSVCLFCLFNKRDLRRINVTKSMLSEDGKQFEIAYCLWWINQKIPS